MTLPTAITGMRNALRLVSGLSVPSALPTTVVSYPTALVYASSGAVDQTAPNDYRAMHRLRIDLLHSRASSPEAVEAVAMWPDAIATIFADSPDLAGAVVAIISPWTYEVAELQFAGKPHFGLRFEVTVKCLASALP